MQQPTLGRLVLVRTPIPFGDQEESVAIVTRVQGEKIDVTLLPAGGGPLPVAAVYPAGHPFAGAYSWRWPERA